MSDSQPVKRLRTRGDASAPGAAPFLPAWLDELGLSASEFRVLMTLWSRANRDMVCWPSVALISSTCRLHADTVWAALRSLEGRELILRRKHSGTRNGNEYLLRLPKSGDAMARGVEGRDDRDRAPPEPTAVVTRGHAPRLLESKPMSPPQYSESKGRVQQEPPETEGLPLTETEGRESPEYDGQEGTPKGSPMKEPTAAPPVGHIRIRFPPVLAGSPEFRACWDTQWLPYLLQINRRSPPLITLDRHLIQCAEWGPTRAIAALLYTIDTGRLTKPVEPPNYANRRSFSDSQGSRKCTLQGDYTAAGF